MNTLAKKNYYYEVPDDEEDRSGLLKYKARDRNKILDLITTIPESAVPEDQVKKILRLHRDHYLANPINVFEYEVEEIVSRTDENTTLIDLGCWTGVLGRQVLDRVKPKLYVGIDAGLWYCEIAKEIMPPECKFRSFYVLPASAVDLVNVDKIYFTVEDPLNTSGFYTRRIIEQEKLAAMPVGKTIRPVDFALYLKSNYDLENLYLKMDVEGVDQEIVQELIRTDTLPKVVHFEMLEKFTPYWEETKFLLEMKYDFIGMPDRPNCTGIIVAVRKGSGLKPATIIWDKTTKQLERIV
jgi:hypothetical protein